MGDRGIGHRRAAALAALWLLAGCGSSPSEANELFEPTAGDSSGGSPGTLGANDATSLTTMGMSMGGSEDEDTMGADPDDTAGPMVGTGDDNDDLDTGDDDDDDDDDNGTTGDDDDDDNGTTGDDDDDDDDTTGDGDTGGLLGCTPVIAEVETDVMGNDNGQQWVKLYNPCPEEVDLTNFTLAWAGDTWNHATLDLEGVIAPNDCLLLGGPNSDADNHDPVFDWPVNLNPNLVEADDNPFGSAAGVAIFADAAIGVTEEPVDAVIYGSGNPNNLVDANGDTPDAYVNDPNNAQVMRRLSQAEDDWELTEMAMPNECPEIPE